MQTRTPLALFAAPLLLTSTLLAVAAGPAQEDEGDEPCTVHLEISRQMRDVVSNVLMHGFGEEEMAVRGFLDEQDYDAIDSDALVRAAAERFDIEPDHFAWSVERFHHVNCDHEGGGDPTAPPAEITDFAWNVTVHVVLHELGHALVREFDLPILGNEETLADAFATYYLTTYLPERAPDVLLARVQSLMYEADEVPRAEWEVWGEHNSDARRAYQIAALAVAADLDAYRPIARAVGMSDRQIRSARDYGAEIHRSWRRQLAPLWMPTDLRSNEARLRVNDKEEGEGESDLDQPKRSTEPLAASLTRTGLDDLFRDVLTRFDWHSQVTLLFQEGSGGAGWSRSKRTITVHRGYIERFIRQGLRIEFRGAGPVTR